MTDSACIKILSGKFQDIIYRYLKVNGNALMEEPPRLSFTYKIIEGTLDPNDTNSFVNEIGGYLVDIITLDEPVFRYDFETE